MSLTGEYVRKQPEGLMPPRRTASLLLLRMADELLLLYSLF